VRINQPLQGLEGCQLVDSGPYAIRLVPGYTGTDVNAHNAFAVLSPGGDLAIREALDKLKDFGIFSAIALGRGASFRLRRRQLAF
jgi:hypothetical protein